MNARATVRVAQGGSMERSLRWMACVCALAAACGSPPAPMDMGMPHPTVSIMPTAATLNPGQTQTFVGTVTGNDDTAVVWTVMESTGGTITSGGVYTAPTALGTYHVIAISHADASATATAIVTVVAAPVQVSVSVSPTDTTLPVGSTKMFTATVQNTSNTAVTWSVMESTGGSIGTDGTYTAPNATGTYHVIATSVADTTKMAAATVHVTVAVIVSPTTATLNAGQQQTFFATVNGSSNQAVTWSVMESTGGSVSVDGTYTAPSTNGTYHVIATSVADTTVSATATVTVTSTPQTSVSILPPAITLDEGQQELFQGTVTTAGGGSTAVTWSVKESAGGSIFSDGTYTAPYKGGTFHVIATSVADTTKTAVATVTVTQATVMLDVSSATIDEGATQQINATLAHIVDPNVDWSVMEVAGGSVSNNGLYTAPLHSGTFHVIAKSHSDPTASATATITVRPIVVVVSPASITLDQSEQHTFTATVTGAVDHSVTWSATGGSINATTGVFTAPFAGGTITITATSNADGATHGLSTVTVRQLVIDVQPPGPLTVDQGATQQFTVTVTGVVDKTYHWTQDCGVVDVNGLYTAPANQTAAQICKVVATSNADNTQATKVTVNVNALSLAINGSSVTLDQGETHGFTATISGIVDKTLTWQSSCNAGTGGGINASSGVFTAPAVAGAGTACSVKVGAADGGLTSATMVTVRPVTIAVAPGSVTLAPTQSGAFVATVTGAVNHAVTWSVVEAGGGTVSSSGIYFAPNSTGTYTVKAVSAADTTLSATGSANVTSTVAVSVSPSSPTLGTGQTQAFAAAVTGTTNGAVTWSTTGGSITPTGVLTAPGSAGMVTVTATSVADNSKKGTATVTVSATPQITVSVAPPSLSLGAGVQQTFTATLTNTSNMAVTWSVQEGAGGGTIDAGGVYTPPAASGTYHVIATSVADPTRFGVSTVSVSTGPPVAVSVNPSSVTLGALMTQSFSAVVSGNSNTAVTWSLGAGSVGSVDVNGLYTAPNSTSGTATVIATSAADSTKSASATVTLTGTVTVTVNPPTPVVQTNGQQKFTAKVTGASNPGVTWGASCGSITNAGLYTAPSTPQSCTITATGMGGAMGSTQASVVVPAGLSISGTVSYAGTPKTGSIFIIVQDGGGRVQAGTHIFGAGPFTIRGLRSNQSYTVRAWDDASGTEIVFNPAADQYNVVGTPTLTTDLTGLAIQLNDPTPVTITTAPSIMFTFPGVGGLGVNYSGLRDAQSNEIADHYTFYVSTSNTPGPTDNVMVRKTSWWTQHQSVMLAPLPAGTYYLAVSAGNSLGEGPLSAPVGPIVMGAPGVGGHTVTGSITIPAGVQITGPLSVFITDDATNGPPTMFRGTGVLAPVNGANPFTIANVPDGALKLHAQLDQLGDGQFGLEDLQVETQITVSGDTTLSATSFSTANGSLQLTTNHQCDGTQAGANCTGVGTQTDQYSFSLEVEPGLKIPLTATLQSGDQMQQMVPLDIGIQYQDNLRNRLGLEFTRPFNGWTPVIGDTLDVLVGYSDGTSEVLHASMTAIMPLPIISVATSPLSVSWATPFSAATGETGVFTLNNFSTIWGIQLARPPQAPPVPYAGPSLSSGTTYQWWVYFFDAAGNQGATGISFVAP
jgi:hypothetical protein